MNNKKFWWLITITALVGTFLYLVAMMGGDQARMNKIENHSEIPAIDTVGLSVTDAGSAAYWAFIFSDQQ